MNGMLLTIFLAIVFCASIRLMLISAVAFVQDIKLFSSAPKEAREVLIPRESELFKGARIMGWALMVFSMVMILGIGIISIWDGLFARTEYILNDASTLTPIYIDENVSSLSAILLNDAYYQALLQGRVVIDDLSVWAIVG